jgi:ComF family protein
VAAFAAILKKFGCGGCAGQQRGEAVFSSSEDRIRANTASFRVAGHPIVTSLVARQVAPRSGSVSQQTPSERNWVRFHWLQRAAESLFSVLVPSDCRICGEPLLNISALPVCLACLDEMHPIRGRVCSVCGERVLSVYAQADEDGLRRCPVCRRLDRPFVRAVAYGSYDDGLRELIHLLKYNSIRPAANVLGRMLVEAIASIEPYFEQSKILVIPVPLYKGRCHQRGFNQAELIARRALKAHPDQERCCERFELTTDVLLRTRDTRSQIGLTSHQRRENMRGAFAVNRASEVIGREVLLVDDVYTTGTTVSECARALRKAGASQVWVATVARTLKLASKYQEIDPEPKEDTKDSAESPMVSAAAS